MVVEGVMSESQTLRNSEYSMKATSVEKSFEIRADSNQENLTVNRNELKLAVDKLNQLAEPIRRKVKFELHDELERYYVTVVDSNTNEVIKEIPPKKMLDMYAEMADFMGILVDKKI